MEEANTRSFDREMKRLVDLFTCSLVHLARGDEG